MDETCGPYNCDCPKAILDLLTPTDSEWANKWRQACRETLANKAKPNALNKLPIGTVIKFIAPYDMGQYKKGDEIIISFLAMRMSSVIHIFQSFHRNMGVDLGVFNAAVS